MDDQRHLFSLREDIHYLNCAYKAPLLKSSEQAAINALKKDRNPVDYSPEDFFENPKTIRTLFSTIAGCNPGEVALLPSSSYGLASALKNVPCRSGQHAITIKNEFPSDYLAIENWCKTHDSSMRIIEPPVTGSDEGETWNQKILEAISSQTAVVVISSVHWMNGLKFNLREIGEKCTKTGTFFIVDGTQSVGALPMDVKKFHIDALICAGYKWLFGPYSTGLAYFGDKFSGGTPIEESWMNRTNASDFSNLTQYGINYTPGAGRFNVGETSNFILLPMVIEGLTQIIRWDPGSIQDYCKKLFSPLKDYIHSIGSETGNDDYSCNHILGLSLPSSIDKALLKDNLAKNKIYLSVRGEHLRVSFHLFNNSKDISRLIEVIDMTLRSL